MSDNETPPISRVLIGQQLIFHSLTSPPCCDSPQKCTPVKYKKRQKLGVKILSHKHPLYGKKWTKMQNQSFADVPQTRCS